MGNTTLFSTHLLISIVIFLLTLRRVEEHLEREIFSLPSRRNETFVRTFFYDKKTRKKNLFRLKATSAPGARTDCLPSSSLPLINGGIATWNKRSARAGTRTLSRSLCVQSIRINNS